MKGRSRDTNGGAPTDLLVCFPSRAHLALMPKPICSPSRPTEPGKRSRAATGGGRGHASPLFKTKSKHMSPSAAEISEPTSPKVTCAGQIKVRPKPLRPTRPDKDWFSVVEEIERMHKEKKKTHWLELLGIKKDVMQFLGALRGLRFDMRCFGSFHGAVDCGSDDEDDDIEEDDDEGEHEKQCESSTSNTIFSKWFMVLEEKHKNDGEEHERKLEQEEEEEEAVVAAPPPNALLLMRCRSAPAKGWSEGGGEEGGIGEEINARVIKEEEKEKERLILMSYAPDFFKVSTEIAKETWVVGGADPLARSRSWRR